MSVVTPADAPAPRGWLRRLGAAGPVALVLPVWPPLGGFILLATLTSLGPWLRDHGAMGMLVYVLLAGFLLSVSFVPTYSCAILAGWAFGFAAGWSLAMITITGSAVVAYAIGRLIARDRALEIIREKPKWLAIHHALLDEKPVRTTTVVALLRVPPISPFAFATFVLAAARVPVLEYTVGTLVGIAPRTALTTFLAAGLEQLSFKQAGAVWTVVASTVATIVVCVVLAALCNRALRGMTAKA